MDTVAPAVATAVASGSPAGLIGGIIVIILLMIPLIRQFWNSSKEANTQIGLYNQLSEQVRLQSNEIKEQRLELERVMFSRVDLQDKLNELKGKVQHLESVEANNEKLRETIEVLKERLDEKDAIITDRVHNLELRLKYDEVKFSSNFTDN